MTVVEERTRAFAPRYGRAPRTDLSALVPAAIREKVGEDYVPSCQHPTAPPVVVQAPAPAPAPQRPAQPRRATPQPRPRTFDWDEAKRLYEEEGLHAGQAAERLGMSRSSVQYALDAMGAPRRDHRGHPRPLKREGRPFDHAEAARRYQAGEGLYDLAKSLHVGAHRLRDALREQGVTIRGRGTGQTRPARPFDHAEARRLYATGLTTGEVAKHLGVKSTRVCDVLREAGELRRPGGRPA